MSDVEDLESFRQRARAFVTTNLRPADESDAPGGVLRHVRTDEEELAGVAHDRALQRMFFDAGLAGIVIPREYGGQGLTPAHQRVLNEELLGREYAWRVQVPTMTPCAAVLLDFGTEEQKKQHIPAMLRGEEIWMQFLSEPSGGSDVAGVLTTATRDGDEWVLNGSKVWTTGAWWSDWGLCLARTNWDVPKHRGLTVFILPIHQPGIDVHRIEMLNGSKEFCQEFISDVRVPDSDRVGEVDDGWTVGTRWMFHERMFKNSPYVTAPVGSSHSTSRAYAHIRQVAEDAGRIDEQRVRELLGEAHSLDLVETALARRIGQGLASRSMSDQASAVSRLFGALNTVRSNSMCFEIAGAAGAAWTDDDGMVADVGNDYLMRQVSCIGGGTTEMARNVISERVLGMPRERTLDRDVAFREVPRGPKSR